MRSIQNLINAVDQLKAEYQKYNLTEEQLQNLDEVLELLQGLENRDKVKDALLTTSS